jgi:hypothetical protein
MRAQRSANPFWLSTLTLVQPGHLDLTMLYNSNSNKDGEPEEEFEHSKWQLKYCFNSSIVCHKEANKQERAAAWEAELAAINAPVKAASALARNHKKPIHVTCLSALAAASSSKAKSALRKRKLLVVAVEELDQLFLSNEVGDMLGDVLVWRAGRGG